MHAIYDANSLPFWSEDEIMERAHLAERFQSEFKKALSERNRAWRFERIEAPMLIPRELLNPEYTDDKIFAVPIRWEALRSECSCALSSEAELFERSWADAAIATMDKDQARAALLAASADDEAAARLDSRLDPLVKAWAKLARREPKELALRPETTPATYEWMRRRLEREASALPYCCWQLNKSFRREQDQPSKHVRLKEFWQQEFQCAYSSDTFEDWQAFVVEPVKAIVADLTRCPARVVVSDRLPAYSVRTIDVEVWNSQKWMEICSISKRIDFPASAKLSKKANAPERCALVAEVATSPDRQHYCSKLWRQAWESLPKNEHEDHDWKASLVSNEAAAKAYFERRS